MLVNAAWAGDIQPVGEEEDARMNASLVRQIEATEI